MGTYKNINVNKRNTFFLCAGLVCLSLYSLKLISDASQSFEKL